MSMTKAEQAEYDRVSSELAEALARVDALGKMADSLKAQTGADAQTIASQTEQIASLTRTIERLTTSVADIGDLRAKFDTARAEVDAACAEAAVLRRDLEAARSQAQAAASRKAISKRPIGRVGGEHGFLVLADTHTVDTQYKSGTVMSSYAVDFYGPAAEAEYLANRTGIKPVTKLADGTPRVIVPSEPQAAAIADGARKLVAQDSLSTKVRCQGLATTGLQVQDAARANGAGVAGGFIALAAPRGAAVSAVEIDGVKGYLIEP